MKKLNIFYLLLFIITLASSQLKAQNFQGEAHYQSVTQMKGFSVKGDGMDPEMEAKIAEQMKKQLQKEFTLKFNLTESYWKEEESLDGAPTAASSGGVVIRMTTAGGTGLYKNVATQRFLRQADIYSKPFLVDDELETREWKLTDETKKIGNYMAQKAVSTKISEHKTMSFSNEGENEMKTVTDTVQIEAWYTPQIPVSQGPGDYWGLPGLILEVSDGRTTYLCTKLTLNPEGGVDIKMPNKGKKVTQEEYEAIREEKTQEMMEKFSSESKGGKTVIKIGGN